MPRALLLVGLIALLAALAACQPDTPVIEKVDLPLRSSPTPVPVLYRTPVPTLTPTPVTPTPTENLDPIFYFGGMLVTLEDVGKTITLKEGQDFNLSLGEGYQWAVVIEPPELVTLNMNITPEPGDQGIYIARDSGQAVLRATGSPTCRLVSPPCMRPDLLFQIHILVE